MRGNGIAKAAERKPSSLMRRLALIAGADVDQPRGPRHARDPGIGLYFGVGLLGSGGVGALALLAAHLAGAAPQITLAPALAAWSSWAAPISAPAVTASRPAKRPEPAFDSFDMPLQRAAGGNIPFQLRIVGDAEAVTGLVLRGMPAGAQLSRGEQRDGTTWIVNVAELPYLQLALADGAPSNFHIRIDVLGRPDMAASSGIARVRIVDAPAPRHEDAAYVPVAPTPVTTVSAPTRAATESPAAARRAIAPHKAEGADRRARLSSAPTAGVAPVPERQVAQAHPEREARHWPDGASGLGAVPRASDRLVWWTLPGPPGLRFSKSPAAERLRPATPPL